MSVIEAIRAGFEDAETIEKAVARLLIARQSTAGSALIQIEQRIKNLLNIEVNKLRNVASLVEDVDGVRQEELNLLGGNVDDVWSVFYHQISNARSTTQSSSASVYDWIKESGNNMPPFSGPEAGGRFLDLAAHHQTYINLKKVQDFNRKEYANALWVKKVSQWSGPEPTLDQRQSFLIRKAEEYSEKDVISWLRSLETDLATLPRYLKYRESDYLLYVSELNNYIKDFLSRQQPLLDKETMESEIQTEFAEAWSNRQVPGWDQMTHEMVTYAIATDRIFANGNVLKGHLTSKQYLKASAEATDLESKLTVLKSELGDRELAFYEFSIAKSLGILSETVKATISEIQRKQARTAAEIQTEADEGELLGSDAIEEIAIGSLTHKNPQHDDQVDSSKSVYNPLNLPIGWDGKPVPFWLYKMHGLGKEFKCEICGNFSYWGQRAFEKHFGETKHTHGLKVLAIENSDVYRFVTTIEDALALKERLASHGGVSFNPEKDAEFEDKSGNVMSAKTYKDLARQGLL